MDKSEITLTNPTDDELNAAVAIPGYPDYLITRCGTVYRCTFKNRASNRTLEHPRKIKQAIKNGYPSVGLYRNGIRKTFWTHALVLNTFAGHRPAGMVAAHRNGNRLDCSLENLRWATPRDNYDDTFRHGTNPAGERNANAKLTERQAKEIFRLSQVCQRDGRLAKQYRVSKDTIRAIRLGIRWGHATGAMLRANGIKVVTTH